MKKFILGLGCLVLLLGAVGVPQADARGILGDLVDAAGDNIDRQWDTFVDQVRFGSGYGNVPDGQFDLSRYREDFDEFATYDNVRPFIRDLLNWILTFLGLIAIAMVIYAGFLYVTDGGEGGGKDKAKKIIPYVAIGILLILASFAIVNTLINFNNSRCEERGEVSVVGADGEIICVDTSDPQYINENNDASTNGFAAQGSIEVTPAGGIIEIGNAVYVPLTVASQTGITFEIRPVQSVAVLWNFGDGVTQLKEIDSDPAPYQATQKYGEEKQYRIKALIEIDEGKILSAERVLYVGGIIPDIQMQNQLLLAKQDIMFDASQSRTPIGSIVSYAWSCVPSCELKGGRNGESETIVFPKQGDYAVTLEVETSFGAKQTLTEEYSIEAEKPLAVLEVPEKDKNSEQLGAYLFDASDSRSVSGDDQGLTYLWDFDGVQRQTSIPKVQFVFDTPGTKDIELKVRQLTQGRTVVSEPVTQQIEVETTLGIDFTVPRTILVDGLVSFTAISQDADRFVWNIEGANNSDIQGPVAEVYFDEPGPKQITLRAEETDREGNVVQKSSLTKTAYVRRANSPLAVADVFVDGKKVFGDIIRATRKSRIEFSSTDSRDLNDGNDLRRYWIVDNQTYTQEEINAYFASDDIDTGVYMVTLIVTEKDNNNLRAEDVRRIQIINKEPEIVSLSINDSVLEDVTMKINATDEDGEIVEYRFEVIENGRVVLAQISDFDETSFDLTQFPGKHTYRFRAKVVDNDRAVTEKTDDGKYEIESEEVNTPPKVSIFPSPSNVGPVGTSFVFYSSAIDPDGDALEYLWMLPDGTTSTYFNATQYFGEVGVYPITLTVDDGLETVTATINITIVNRQGVVTNNNTVNNSGTEDDNTNGNTNTGGNTNTTDNGNSNANNDNTNTNTEGNTNKVVDPWFPPQNTKDKASNTRPEASIVDVYPALDGGLGQVFTFFSEASDKDGDVLNYRWDFGDGSTASVYNGSHIYTASGNYTVTLTVSDGIDTVTDSIDIVVQPQYKRTVAPKVKISRVIPGNTGDTQTQFTFVPRLLSGSEKPIYYQWNFGDGNESNAQIATHWYDEPGIYTVTLEILQAYDPTGNGKVLSSDRMTVTIVGEGEVVPPSDFVNEESGTIGQSIGNTDNRPPVGIIDGMSPGNTGNTDTVFSFFSYATDPDRDLVQFEWNFGDGYTSRIRNAAHRYTTPGQYPVSLTVSDGQDFSVSETIMVTVVDIQTDIPRPTRFENYEPGPKVDTYIGIVSPATQPRYLLNVKAEYERSLAQETDATVVTRLQSELVKVNAQIAFVEKIRMQNKVFEGAYIKQLQTYYEYEKSRLIQEINDVQEASQAAILEQIKRIEDLQTQAKDRPVPLLQSYGITPGNDFFPFVTMTGNTDTVFFLYGLVPQDHPRPILIKWHTGDGREHYGQNFFVSYDQPGMYVVNLSMSDGLMTLTDSAIIYVE